MIGVDVERGPREVRRAANRPRPAAARQRPRRRRPPTSAAPAARRRCPTCATRASRSSARRSSWSSSTRWRSAGPPATSAPDDFTHPTYRAVWELIAAAGGPAAGAGDPGWAARLRDARRRDPAVSSAVSALAVEPLLTPRSRTRAYVAAARRPAPRAHRAAPDHRPEVQAAAHQPGRAARATTTGCSASWPRSSSTAARCATGRRQRSEHRRPRLRLPDRRPRSSRARGAVLARADADGAVSAGTRDALYVPSGDGHVRVPWEQVEAADWDQDAESCGSPRSAPGARSARSTASRSPSPAGCSSWSASGSPPASCSSGTCRSRARAGVRVIARRAPSRRRSRRLVLRVRRGHRPRRPVRRAGRRDGPRGGPATRSGWPDRAADFSRTRRRRLLISGPHRSPVAQLAEHSTVNRRVVGSSPTGGAILAASHLRPQGWGVAHSGQVG